MELTELGRKIFLDRYAVKDMKKDSLKEGDIVIALTDAKTKQREIGTVKSVEGTDVTVELTTGETLTVKAEAVDKPLETDVSQMFERVAKALAGREKDKDFWTGRFKWLLDEFKFVPGGRILTGAGTNQNLTYFNCYVLPSPKDSRKGIVDRLGDMTEVMSRGGGVGMNISSIRPRHAFVKGVNGRSSGSVSWAGLFSFVTGLIEQGGSRRGALMLMLDAWHPDLMDFITCKKDLTKITNANLSVNIPDAFMEAVKNDADWTFKFPDTSYKAYDEEWDGDLAKWVSKGYPVIDYETVKAKDVWDTIIKTAYDCAEPGVFFGDTYNRMSNSYYYSTIRCTNPCGEQGLPSWGVCNLGSINLSKFVADGNVDWDSLKETVHLAVRFLDNVIDDTPYFFKQNEEQQKSERRVGMGTMGLAEMLLKLHIAYGSKESLTFIDKLYHFIATEAYTASAMIAEEKGSFSKFECDKFLESGFMKQMDDEVKNLIREKGLRNCTILTQAPTGTTGTMVGTSTGIEPYYFWEWTRNSRMGKATERVPEYDAFKTEHPDEELPSYFVSAMDLLPEDHVKVQAAIQKWTDSSISKTCNTPHDYTVEQTKQLYEMLYESGCKGGTTYRDGSRDTQVLVTKDSALEKEKNDLEEENKRLKAEIEELKANQCHCEDGECHDHEQEKKVKSRPSVICGRTYKRVTPVGTAYITVNRIDGQGIFEVFVSVGKVGSDVAADSEALGRTISYVLRMPSSLSINEKINGLVGQLAGIGSGNSVGFGKNRVTSIADAVSQVLKEEAAYDEEAVEEASVQEKIKKYNLTPDICPDCGSASLYKIEGCRKCLSCGYSKC